MKRMAGGGGDSSLLADGYASDFNPVNLNTAYSLYRDPLPGGS
jgi:hypothetical protein